MNKILRLWVVAAVIAVIAGCGVRGPLEPHPASKENKEDTGTTAKSDETEKKHKPFILDGLLR
ncbi:MAG: lipoprotein [Pseudomonadota bacterium]